LSQRILFAGTGGQEIFLKYFITKIRRTCQKARSAYFTMTVLIKLLGSKSGTAQLNYYPDNSSVHCYIKIRALQLGGIIMYGIQSVDRNS